MLPGDLSSAGRRHPGWQAGPPVRRGQRKLALPVTPAPASLRRQSRGCLRVISTGRTHAFGTAPQGLHSYGFFGGPALPVFLDVQFGFLLLGLLPASCLRFRRSRDVS